MNEFVNIKKGLTSYQLKITALIFMTIGYMGVLGSDIPFFKSHGELLGQIKGISAALFLYMITESIRYTRSKIQFIKRLYFAGLATGLLTTLIHFYVGSNTGIYYRSDNILFTYFFVALYIYLCEYITKAINERKFKQIIMPATIILITFISVLLYVMMNELSSYLHISARYMITFRSLFLSILPNPLNVEYSVIFIFMGILIYFAKTKKMKCIIFFVFCILFCIGSYYSLFWRIFEYNQYIMVFALPFMLLYNGKRGIKHKLFFYLYYPIHRFVIVLINTLFT